MAHVMVILAWLFGLLLQQQQAELLSTRTYFLAGVAAVVLARARWRMPRPWLAAGLAAAMLAWSWSGLRATLKPALDERIAGVETRLVRGVVSSWPRDLPDGVQFDFWVTHWRDPDEGWQAQDMRLKLSWYRVPAEVTLRAGDQWQWLVRVRPAHGHRNPYGVDAELRDWRDEVAGVGYVLVKDSTPQRLGTDQAGALFSARDAWRERLLAADLPARAQAWLAALVLGDRSLLSAHDWEVLQATGTAHLLSVSGLHITVWAGLAWWLTSMLWTWAARLNSRAVQSLPRAQVASWGALLLALLYAALSGGAIPVQRAWLMLFTLVVLRSRAVVWPAHLVMGVVGVVVTAWDPWAVQQAGFWLSFVAVWALSVVMARPAPGVASKAYLLWLTQWRIGWVLMPVSAAWLGQVSWLGFGVNLLAIPWVTLLVLPMALLGLLWPTAWSMASWLLVPMITMMDALSSAVGGVWWVKSPPFALVVPAVLALWWSMRVGAWRWRVLCWVWLLPALLWRDPPPPHGAFEVTAWDIGQGSAVLVRTAEHVLLYDTGPAYWSGGDAASRLLIPNLRKAGLHLDAVVLSHQDLDHVGGRASVLKAYPDVEVWSSFDLAERPTRACTAGQTWTWEGVKFEFVHPQRLPQGRANNEDSCVLRLEAQGASALMTGDITAAQESALLKAGAVGRVDLLIAAHHGSKSSTSEAWLQALAPRWVWMQAGYANRYRHPSTEVLERLEKLSLPWQQTADCGALTWRSDQVALSQCERLHGARYWSHAPK